MVIKSETVCFTVPEVLRLELGAIPKTGYYDSTSEFLRDAMRTLLAARKDVRISVAVVLYEEEKISLGRAVEIAGVNYEEMKRILAEKGIVRKGSATTRNEMEEELRKIKK